MLYIISIFFLIILIFFNILNICVSRRIYIEDIKNIDISNKKVILCFMVRDGEKYLKNNLEKINKFLKNNFNVYHILYIENDSIDNTRNILKNLEKSMPLSGEILNLKNKYSVDMCKNTKEYNCKKRTNFLGFLRQKLVDNVKSKFSNYDYMVMCDLDFIAFDFNDLKNMFSILIHKNYDAIFGMSVKSNNEVYDTAAISPLIHKYLYSYFFKKNQSTTKVSSAFSGFGIYSIKKVIDNGSHYTTDSTDIEHIHFNKNLDTYVYNNFTPVY